MSTVPRNFLPKSTKLMLSVAFLFGTNLLGAGKLGTRVDFVRAENILASGDTALALDILTSAAGEADNTCVEELRQGFLHYYRGDYDLAEQNFKQATISDHDPVKFLANLGLAKTYDRGEQRNTKAMKYLRRALAIYPDDIEAFYTKFRIYYNGGRTEDMRLAKNALFRVAEWDICYRDIYRIWSDSLLDRTFDEIRRFDELLTTYLHANPDSASWWIDLARDRFLADGPGPAVEALDELQAANSDFHHPEIPLLRARCRLEQEDSLEFQELYWKAVRQAGECGDFERLFIEAEPIFIPETYEKWEAAKAEKTEVQFFHYFWADINPDKLSPVNKRLVEHYVRLRYAETNYRLLFPSTEFQTNINSFILLSFTSSTYDFDPKVMFGRSRQLCLDSRGLLYMRYGKPDQIISSFPDKAPPMNQLEIAKYRDDMRMENRNEVWWYGKVPFTFEQVPRTGGYIFRALEGTGLALGDMQAAMNTQLFRTDHILEQEEYYVAQFMAEDKVNLEVEIYQDQLLSDSLVPSATAAAYDTLWREKQRTTSPVFRIPGEEESRWVAIHTLQFPPGKSKYAIRMASGEETWNGRGELDLKAFAIDCLELSAIVLGIDPPDENAPAHERHGVRFIPRPSFRFRKGEAIRVYLEYYNLTTGKGSKRSYREYVDVMKYEGERNNLGRLLGNLKGILTFGESKEGSSVTQIFDREADSGQGPVAESFSVDTSDLSAGKYRLTIESRDNADGFWDDEAVMFEITED